MFFISIANIANISADRLKNQLNDGKYFHVKSTMFL